jgi:hypothetical protein
VWLTGPSTDSSHTKQLSMAVSTTYKITDEMISNAARHTVEYLKVVTLLYFVMSAICCIYDTLTGHPLMPNIMLWAETVHFFTTYAAWVMLATKCTMLWIHEGFSRSRFDDIGLCCTVYCAYRIRNIVAALLCHSIAQYTCPFSPNATACVLTRMFD